MFKQLIYFALIVVGIECQNKCEEFSCFDNKTMEHQVMILGETFDCPDDKICNQNSTNGCAPCIKSKCSHIYTCKDGGTLIVKGLEFQCPKNKRCQPSSSSDCTPCIDI